jgi:hypothetical protein
VRVHFPNFPRNLAPPKTKVRPEYQPRRFLKHTFCTAAKGTECCASASPPFDAFSGQRLEYLSTRLLCPSLPLFINLLTAAGPGFFLSHPHAIDASRFSYYPEKSPAILSCCSCPSFSLSCSPSVFRCSFDSFERRSFLNLQANQPNHSLPATPLIKTHNGIRCQARKLANGKSQECYRQSPP